MNHPHRGPVTVDLTADWTPYVKAIPNGGIALGTVQHGPDIGALVYLEDQEVYLIVAPKMIRILNSRKVKCAIHQQQPDVQQPREP